MLIPVCISLPPISMLFSTLRSARRKNASYLPRQPQRCDKHRHFDDEHGLTATSFGSKGKGLASCPTVAPYY